MNAERKNAIRFMESVDRYLRSGDGDWDIASHPAPEVEAAIKHIKALLSERAAPTSEERREMLHWVESWRKICQQTGDCSICELTVGGVSRKICEEFFDKLRSLLLSPPPALTGNIEKKLMSAGDRLDAVVRKINGYLKSEVRQQLNWAAKELWEAAEDLRAIIHQRPKEK